MNERASLFTDRELDVILHALTRVELPDDWGSVVSSARSKTEKALRLGEVCETCGNVRGAPKPTSFACQECWDAV